MVAAVSNRLTFAGQRNLDNQMSAHETGFSRENYRKAFRKAIVDEDGNSGTLIAVLGH